MIARRAEEIAPFIVTEVLERAREMERQGIDVVHLEVGEPDFDIPAFKGTKMKTCFAKDSDLRIETMPIIARMRRCRLAFSVIKDISSYVKIIY